MEICTLSYNNEIHNLIHTLRWYMVRTAHIGWTLSIQTPELKGAITVPEDIFLWAPPKLVGDCNSHTHTHPP